MIGSASGDMGQLNSEISFLESQRSDLEGKLDLKYDINSIEDEVSEFGMIKREHADNQYVELECGDEVTVYEEEEKVGIAALLAAFGIELD